jgi:isopropylmalate/homocitrate/citramalate synthase
MELPTDVTVMDLTLREARQTDGVSLTTEQIGAVAKRLDAAGVPAIEMHHDDPEEIRTVASLGLEVDIMALIHPTAALGSETAVEEVAECIEAGADIVCFAYPISPYNFSLYESMAGFSPSREEALELA